MKITPERLLDIYSVGLFPMGPSRDSPDLQWIDPNYRGVLPRYTFHVPRRLRKTIRKEPYDIRVDTAFARVIEGCAALTIDRDETWINDTIMNLYTALHRMGYAHSVECWLGDELVGGLYGVALNGAFFGESMFSRATDASKIALVHLVDRLQIGGFVLLDAQFHNPHLEQFGLEEWSRDTFHAALEVTMSVEGDFSAYDGLSVSDKSGAATVQRVTQTS